MAIENWRLKLQQVDKTSVKIAGFGGQGVVLASIILGRSAILDGRYATQVASYGSESRGGECQAEIVISSNPIDYPHADKVQTLVVMSQPALSKYLTDLLPGGTLFVDPDMVKGLPERKDIKIIRICAAKTADNLGRRIVENIVMLGALQATTRIVTEESLLAAIEEYVPSKTVELNLSAAREGIRITSELGRPQ
jgi:2-oxoglutarate ferredoxin oxidoreductase subunit gamma